MRANDLSHDTTYSDTVGGSVRQVKVSVSPPKSVEEDEASAAEEKTDEEEEEAPPRRANADTTTHSY